VPSQCDDGFGRINGWKTDKSWRLISDASHEADITLLGDGLRTAYRDRDYPFYVNDRDGTCQQLRQRHKKRFSHDNLCEPHRGVWFCNYRSYVMRISCAATFDLSVYQCAHFHDFHHQAMMLHHKEISIIHLGYLMK
jgi:hypothetical protein